ncbi:protein of unknown function [Microbacterium sp. Nx66]|uniref:hypothetical protein n=1 Tax=Microbacterium sp. Nx66 TaxID=2766784 RepID=UPI001657537C|nr:hypothetical protein [Microbacterium sp. Nx66]CAD5140711.1 protein of unknown function [Microbacterium sp. Nx66]
MARGSARARHRRSGTQYREVEEVAREVIGLFLDVEPDAFDVNVSIEIPENARAAWEESKKREALARTESEAAAALARRAIATLRADGLTFRDAGAVLGLSPQRVQQLAADIAVHKDGSFTAKFKVKERRGASAVESHRRTGAASR